MDAIILAGGKGTRLQHIIKNIPKPLAPINGIPFLDFLISFLQGQKEINKIILSIGYEKDQIIKRYKNLENIVFCEESFPLGTGGALKKAFDLADSENVLALNGDSYIQYSLTEFLDFHTSQKADISILANHQKNLSRYGSINIDSQTKKIISFQEKKEKKEGFINSGVYLMNKNIFKNFDLPLSFSIEIDFFPLALQTSKIFGYEITSPFIDIGTETSYLEAQNIFSFLQYIQ